MPRLIMIIAIIIAAAIMAVAISLQKKRNKDKADNKEGLTFLPKGREEGVVFGNYKGKRVCSPTKDEGHIVVFGGSGKGKTSALLIPTLRVWKGTFFAIDISGDIQKNVSSANAIIYNPTDKNTIPFNVFAPIDEIESFADKNEALEQMAHLIMPDVPGADDTTSFFTKNGRKILTAALIAFYYKGVDFTDICEAIVSLSYEKLFQFIRSTKNEQANLYIGSFDGSNEKNTAGCKQAVDEKIGLFATNASVKNSVRRPKENEDSLTALTVDERSVFVIIPDEKLKLYAPLLGLITATTLEFLSKRETRKDPKVLLCLDEFASLGKLSMLDALRKLRKKNVRIMPLTQSLADVDLIYGDRERKAMLDNFAYKVVLSASNTETQEYFAKLIGYEKEKKYSYTKSERSNSTTTSEHKEYAVEPATLDRLGDDLILLHPFGYLRLNKNFYFKN